MKINLFLLIILLLFCWINFLDSQPLKQQLPYKINSLKINNQHLPDNELIPRSGITTRRDSLNMRMVGRWISGNCKAVSVAENIVYFGNGPYLEIVDFSDPLDPNELGKILLPDPSINGIAIQGNYAYVSNEDDGLRTIDISNPVNPQEVGYLVTKYALGVAVNGNYAYVADGYDGLKVIDISNPTNLREN